MTTRLTTQNAAPSVDNYVEGRYALHHIWRTEASALAPVVPSVVTELATLNINKPTWDKDDRIFRQGSGDLSARIKRGYNVSGTLEFSNGIMVTELAALFGLTMGSTNTNAIPGYVDKDEPHIIWEACRRKRDNVTHLDTIVIPDMIIDDWGFSDPIDNAPFTIEWHSYFPFFALYTGREVVYDVFTGDGSTTDFTLSGTPINLWTNSNYDLLDYDTLVYVKEKASGATTGTFKKSGYTQTTTTLAAGTAPPASTLVQCLYAKASA